VTSYVIPPPSPPIPPDPQPQPIQHPVKTPPSTPTHVADVRPPVSDVPSNIPIADSRPAEPTAPPSAPVEVAPSPLAYGSRTRVPYPIDAARRHEHGTVVLRVLVGTDGRPQTVEIESSSGSPRLDTAARTAVAQWTFKAGTRDGLAYAAWARVPITFDLQTL
jgi:protein TonB